MGVTVMVAIPGVASFAPDDRYNVEHFVYNRAADTYACPQGEVLHTNGRWYVKSDHGYVVKHYKTPHCPSCPAFALCTRNRRGRLIERSEYQPFVERNKENIQKDPATYKKRQAIIEHTYGIIKRQWGFYFVCTKRGIKRASADVGLMFTAFNLRRLINIIDKNLLKKFLRELASLFFSKRGLSKPFWASWPPRVLSLPSSLLETKAVA